MLTRIYGTAWNTEKELNKYLHELKRLKKEITEKLVKKWIYFIFKMKLREWYFGIQMDGLYIDNLRNFVRSRLQKVITKK